MTEKSSTELTEEIKARVRRNLEEIFTAVAGKNVTVMAATKTVPAEVINYATQECTTSVKTVFRSSCQSSMHLIKPV